MKLSTILSTAALLVISTSALAFPTNPNAIPEPETYALLGLAAAAFVAARWKK